MAFSRLLGRRTTCATYQNDRRGRMKGIEILPTIVPSSFDDIILWSARFKDFAAWVQVDLGDGKFVSNTTWVPTEGETLPHTDVLSYEFHLMTQEPRELGLACIRAGAQRIIGHIETFSGSDGAREALMA